METSKEAPILGGKARLIRNDAAAVAMSEFADARLVSGDGHNDRNRRHDHDQRATEARMKSRAERMEAEQKEYDDDGQERQEKSLELKRPDEDEPAARQQDEDREPESLRCAEHPDGQARDDEQCVDHVVDARPLHRGQRDQPGERLHRIELRVRVNPLGEHQHEWELRASLEGQVGSIGRTHHRARIVERPPEQGSDDRCKHCRRNEGRPRAALPEPFRQERGKQHDTSDAKEWSGKCRRELDRRASRAGWEAGVRPDCQRHTERQCALGRDLPRPADQVGIDGHDDRAAEYNNWRHPPSNRVEREDQRGKAQPDLEHDEPAEPFAADCHPHGQEARISGRIHVMQGQAR